ncbi:hypothetical protein H5410_049023 [Solanum commersonii]|uniref:Uncharacterized protein n=1 Tax=Solanum commersonii TaxID=4109 RepID=A0A9J5XL79_SOLCO|nr:hypothetical protein H5410_049023 [Solanum commersonii]
MKTKVTYKSLPITQDGANQGFVPMEICCRLNENGELHPKNIEQIHDNHMERHNRGLVPSAFFSNFSE